MPRTTRSRVPGRGRPDEEHRASAGGGPLRGIADDHARGEGERALAGSMISFMRQRQAMHGRRFELAGGPSLSFAQLKLLFHLPPSDGAVPLSRFAEAAALTPASVTQALGPLEDAGLVRRVRSEVDRRIVDVCLTDRGGEVLARLRDHFTQRWDAELAAIPDDRLRAAAEVLERLHAVFGPPPD